jgi:hypothetical protein
MNCLFRLLRAQYPGELENAIIEVIASRHRFTVQYQWAEKLIQTTSASTAVITAVTCPLVIKKSTLSRTVEGGNSADGAV